MSLPRPRLDYALTVGPLLLALLAFTTFHHCVPTVSGKYIKFCVFVHPADCRSRRHMSRAPLLGNRSAERRRAPARWTRRVLAYRSQRGSSRRILLASAAPFPLTADITVLSCQFALLSVSKISTTIAVDRVSRTLREYSTILSMPNDRRSSKLSLLVSPT
ncbi:hypothetical protein ALC56_00133 [Trachymyrmex septentrionalis]|uniref:Uncharacterized protein n=1 Tax=Trachymyrmex septentrionalis TaxID=34720 RepID=A0A195G075_9HYME|nr:hypothetical protein ALC56_00133 [Trachymyrmex septentrionalis]